MIATPTTALEWLQLALVSGVIALGWCAGLLVWSLLAKGGKLLVARRS